MRAIHDLLDALGDLLRVLIDGPADYDQDDESDHFGGETLPERQRRQPEDE